MARAKCQQPLQVQWVCCMLLRLKSCHSFRLHDFITYFTIPSYLLSLPLLYVSTFFFYWLNLSYYIVMMINFTHYIQLWCTFDRSSTIGSVYCTLMLTLALSHRNNAPSYGRDSRAETQRESKSAYFVGQCFSKWKCLKYFTELISSTHNWS